MKYTFEQQNLVNALQFIFENDTPRFPAYNYYSWQINNNSAISAQFFMIFSDILEKIITILTLSTSERGEW